MKKYFALYRPFFIFLLKFFGVYVVLTAIYQLYLNRYDQLLTFEVDRFTQSVAQQVQWVLQVLDFQTQLLPHPKQASVKLVLENVYVSRVVEGCNAISVMILFVAFVVAFSGKLKTTLAFILLGCGLIHVLNVLRIALLSVALYYSPEQEPLLHGVVFPLFIYGVVFLLWVLWVNQFSNYAANKVQ